MAALAMQRALELDVEESHWRKERDRLLLCIPEQTSTLLQVRNLTRLPRGFLRSPACDSAHRSREGLILFCITRPDFAFMCLQTKVLGVSCLTGAAVKYIGSPDPIARL